MSCLLLVDSKIRKILRGKIANNLVNRANNGEPVKLDDYVREIYNFFKEKGAPESLALDAARIVPILLDQVLVLKPELQTVLKKASPRIRYEALEMSEKFEESVDNVREMLGLTETPAPVIEAVQEGIDAVKTQEKLDVQAEAVKYNPIPYGAFRSFGVEIVNYTDPNAPGYMEPKPEMKHAFTVMYAIDEAMQKQIKEKGISDSSKIDYPGVEGGIYLKIMGANYGEMIMTLVKSTGEPIKFDSEGKVSPNGASVSYNVTSDPLRDSSGKIITDETEFRKEIAKVKNAGQRARNEGTFKNIQANIAAQIAFRNPENKPLSPEEKKAAHEEAVKNLLEQYAIQKTMRDYLAANKKAFIMATINGGSKGFVNNNVWKRTDLSTIDFSTSGFYPIVETKAQTEGSLLTEGVVYFKYPGVDEPVAALGKAFVDRPEIMNKVVSLFTGDIFSNETGKNVRISIDERNRLLQQFLFTSDIKFKSNEVGGGGRNWLDSKGNFTLKVGDKTFPLRFDGSPEAATMQQNAAVAIKDHLSKPWIEADEKGFPRDKSLNSNQKIQTAKNQGANIVYANPGESFEQAVASGRISPGSVFVITNAKGGPDAFRVYYPTVNASNNHLNKNYDDATFTELKDGGLLLNKTQKAYNDYLLENFTTPATTVNGKIRTVNGFMAFAPVPSEMSKLVVENKSAKPTEVNEAYKGKVIYATPGSGKTAVASNTDDIIDADNLLIAEIEKLVPDFFNVAGLSKELHPGQILLGWWNYAKENNMRPEAIYETVRAEIKDLVDNGMTVLTGSTRLLDMADHVFVQKDVNKVRQGFSQEREMTAIKAAGKTVTPITAYMTDVLTKAPENVTAPAIEKKVETPAEKNTPLEKKTVSQMSKEEIMKAMMNKKINKGAKAKAMEARSTAEQIRAAEEWYTNSPLSKIFPFKTVFAAINSSYGGPAAQWAVHGVTLFHYYNEDGKIDQSKSGDYTDLYHEAWHGFTQTFLTPEQRTEMYAEAAKREGSFKDFKGNYVTFKNASWEQLEEFMAEEFREYAKSGGKMRIKNSPKTNSIFRQLLNWLKNLFSKTKTQDVIANPLGTEKIFELYDKLYTGNLAAYNFDINNRDQTIGSMDHALLANNPESKIKELGYDDSNLLVGTVDSLISGIINEFNVARGDSALTSEMMRDPETAAYAYRMVKDKLTDEILPKLRAKADAAKNEFEKNLVEQDIELVQWAIDNFGDVDNISAARRSGKGIIAYHIEKSKYLTEEDKEVLSNDDIDETKIILTASDLHSQSGNEKSQLEMAAPEVKTLLRSIHKYDEKGNPVLNRLGVQELNDHHHMVNKLARVLNDSTNMNTMYQKLREAAFEGGETVDHALADVIAKLGPPTTDSTASKNLWINFWSTFNMASIKLIQMNIEKEGDDYSVRIGNANTYSNKVANLWKNIFRTQPTSKFIKRNQDESSQQWGNNFLDLTDVINTFSDGEKLKKGSEFDFLRAIGVNLSDKPAIRKAVTVEGGNVGSATQMFKRLKRILNERQITQLYSLDDIFKEYPSDGKLAAIENEMANFNDLKELETRNSDYANNYMVTNAEGNTQFEQSLHNTISIMVATLNEVESYAQLMSIPHMRYLDVNANPFAAASVWLNSLFDMDNVAKGGPGPKRKTGGLTGENVRINMSNLSGIQLIDENGDQGVSSAGSDEFSKLILDFHLNTMANKPELMRHADKGTSFSVWLSNVNGGSMDNKTYVDVYRMIKNQDGDVVGYGNVANILQRYVDAELKRIKKLEEISKQETLVYDNNYLKEGQNFVIFESILSDDVKKQLLNHGSLQEAYENDPELSSKIKQQIVKYFEDQTKDVKDLMAKPGAEFIDKALVEKTRIKANTSGISTKTINSADTKDGLVRAFVVNSWIHNLESMSMIYGDIAQYNHAKEEFHKRNAGAGSTGKLFASDVDTINYVNNKGRQYAKSRGITEKKMATDGSYDSAILADNEIPSVSYDDYYEAIRADLGRKNPKADPADLDAKAKAAAKAYTENNEGDAQGWITFDFYRALSIMEGKWSSNQEKMYNDIVAGKPVDPLKTTEFFPTRKFQYWGPVQVKDGMPPLNAFHKFSLLPLIPSIVGDNGIYKDRLTNLGLLHEKMMNQQIDYALFKSGSKISTITKIQNGKTIQDEFYTDGKEHTFNADSQFVKNTVYVQFLKDQLEIAPYFKEQVTFPTQMRKLIENGLMEGGVPTDFKVGEPLVDRQKKWNALSEEEKMKSKRYAMVKEYEADIEKLTNLRRKELEAEANIQRDAQGNILMNDRLAKFLVDELKRQDLGEHEIAFLKEIEGKLAKDLSISLSAEKMEKVLNSIVVRRLVKQKFKGEGLIQISGAGFETPLRGKLTDEEKANYGTNGLPFYQQGDVPKYGPNKIINVYHGTNENAELSNFAQRPVETELGKFNTVEAAFQFAKAQFADDDSDIGYRIAQSKTGAEAKRLGSQIKNLDVKAWDKASSAIMKDIIKKSFEQNADALAKLKATGKATLTHTQDKGKWGKEFPKLLMEVRDELIQFGDGKTKAMKVKIALQGDFLNLLYLKHKDGEPIATRERLNEMLKDEAWLNEGDNRKMVSIIGPRIPVQGLNSMEFAEVYEFLPIEAGNIVVLPTEIVAKAGSDFDIDKLTFLMPNISSGANYEYWTTPAGKAKLEEIRKLNPELEVELSDKNIASVIENRKSKEKSETDRMILKMLADNSQKNVKYVTGNSAEGLENKILNNMRNILELEENFVDLIRPNGTDIVKEGLADGIAEYVMDFNPRTATYIDKKGKEAKRIPGTRVFETRYNLYKHASNNIGKQTLGLGAVDNTYNGLFNRIGARMNHQYTSRGVVKRLDILLQHNTLKDENGNDVISLSNLMDANNEHSISDVISQLMNGWVDIAKDAWIFNIQGNKEVAPVLLFMVQAGVPIKQAVYMAANPMVRAYVKEQKLARSTFAGPLDKSPGNWRYYRSQARKIILGSPKYGINLSESQLGNAKEMEKAVYARTLELTGPEGTQLEFFDKNNVTDNLFKRVTEFSKAQKEEGFNEKDFYTDADRAVFLHFLELEEMAKSMTAIKTKTNVDTSRSNTLFEAQSREEMIEELKSDGKFPDWMITKLIGDPKNGIKGESPIASFNILDFQVKLWKDFFKLRNDPKVNEFILAKMKDQGFRDLVEETWGEPEKLVNQFRNGLVPFIFQNYMRNFDIDNVKTYRGVDVSTSFDVKTVPSLQYGVYVQNENGVRTFYVDKAKLKKDYQTLGTTKSTGKSRASLDPAAFPTAGSYYSFVFERELLRSMYPAKTHWSVLKERGDVQMKLAAYKEQLTGTPDEKIEALVYEETLRDMALDNTFNMWKLFKSRSSMADQLIQLQVMYPELAKQYAVINNMAPSILERGGNRTANIMLTDIMMDADKVNLFNQNLKELSDASRIKLNTDNAQERQRVAEFFKKLSVYAFLQSGMNTTGMFSLVRVVPQERFTGQMIPYAADFMDNMNALTLQRYWNQFLKVSRDKKTRSRLRDYSISDFNPRKDAALAKGKSMDEIKKLVNAPAEASRFAKDNSGNTIYYANPSLNQEGQLVKGLTQSEAIAMVTENPNTVFVMNGAIESMGGANKDEKALINAKDKVGNVVPFPTKKTFGYSNFQLKDVTAEEAEVLQAEEKKQEAEPTVDAFKYFGRMYNIQVVDGKAVDVLDVGKTTDKKKILDAYNTNKNVDPQNGKPFRGATYTPEGKVTEKQIVVPKGSSSTNLPIFETEDKIYLMNDGQQAAYNNIKAFVLSRLNKRPGSAEPVKFDSPMTKEFSGVIPQSMWDNMIGLVGRGGVGKTTVIKKVLQDIMAEARKDNPWESVDIMYAAPTHNAVTMLQEALGMDSERTGGVQTLASMVARNQSYTSKDKEPTDTGASEDGLFLLKEEEYKKRLKFVSPISNADIIVIDESSMVDTQFIKDLMFRFKTENTGKMPIFIYMGDFRQLPPVDTKAGDKKPFREGIISATLFGENSGKFSELTEVMRSKDEAFHQIFDSVGDQITEQRKDVDSGKSAKDFDFSEYDALTSESSENMLVVQEKQVDRMIDMYVDVLATSDNPYEMFWTHYNNISNARTQELFNKIREAYFKKLGIPMPTGSYKAKNGSTRYEIGVGDYVQSTFTLPVETKADRDLEISKGVIKPTARFKVMDIIPTEIPLSNLNTDLYRALGNNLQIPVKKIVLYNRQGQKRVVVFPAIKDSISVGQYNAARKTMEISIKDKEGKAHSMEIPYYKWKEIMNEVLQLNQSFEDMFLPSYIGSTHTVQGASIKKIIVGDYNIRLNAPSIALRDMESSLYTALTRAAEKLIIIKPNTVPIKNNQDQFQLMTVPTVPTTTEEAKEDAVEGAPEIVEKPTEDTPLPLINGATVDPRVKAQIDATIQTMLEYKKNGYDLAFPGTGFGQYMIGADDLTGVIDPTKTPIAKATFVYLSEQLFKHFQYVNPNFEKALYDQGSINVVQQNAPITDEQVQQELDFFDKHCGG